MMKYKRMQTERRRLLNAGRRFWFGDNDDLDVAPHEAGHVVVGWLLDLNPTRATIDSGDGYAGATSGVRPPRTKSDRDLLYAHTVFLMAGGEAERLVGGPDDGGKDDLAKARAAIGLICRSSAEIDVAVDCARRTARQMLKENFASLLAITSALLTKRTLDQDEIEELLASSIPDADDDRDEDVADPILTRMLDPRRIIFATDGEVI
jgi:ATP-dependent Zn protease